MVRFIHSSDWQIGMPFHWVCGDGAAKLRELRMLAIDRLCDLAQTHQVAFVLVAGDLFDANTISEKVVLEALERIAAFPCPVYAIPGNHDHGGLGSIYHHDLFLKHKPANLIIFTHKEAVLTSDAGAWLLPAPLLQRHEAVDPTHHITAQLGGHNAPRIGIAHGSIRRFDQSGDGTVPNLIDPGRAKAAELDYLALGDWHGMQQIDERTWYCGTPEPTSFKDNQAGKALLVTLEGHGATPHVEPLSTGQAQWVSHSFDLYHASDIEALRHWLDTLTTPRLTLLNLTLKGTLTLSELSDVHQCVESASLRLLFYREHSSSLLVKAAAEDLDTIASDGYVRMAIDRLVDMEKQGNASASYALQILYQLKQSSC